MLFEATCATGRSDEESDSGLESCLVTRSYNTHLLLQPGRFRGSQELLDEHRKTAFFRSTDRRIIRQAAPVQLIQFLVLDYFSDPFINCCSDIGRGNDLIRAPAVANLACQKKSRLTKTANAPTASPIAPIACQLNAISHSLLSDSLYSNLSTESWQARGRIIAPNQGMHAS